jgi:hypothetical protein
VRIRTSIGDSLTVCDVLLRVSERVKFFSGGIRSVRASQCCGGCCSVNEMDAERVGKVFVVVGGMRRCLVCDGIFTTREAAEHAVIPCHPTTKESALRNWKSTQ